MPGILSTGYRKTSIARIILKPGDGKFRVNGKDMENYFPSLLLQKRFLEVFETVNKNNQFDVNARIIGGGISSQSDALRHALALLAVALLARALVRLLDLRQRRLGDFYLPGLGFCAV